MEVRIATLSDIESLCELYSEFFAYNADLQPEYCSVIKEIGDYPRSVITSSNADIFVAVEGKNAVGFFHIRQMQTPSFSSVVPHKYAEIIDFMVTASHRKQGIGSKLMEAAKQWSNTRSLDYIELMALTDAKEALQFYNQRGFATMSHIMRFSL